MNDIDLKQLKEVIQDVVGESHQGVSKSVSSNTQELKDDVKALTLEVRNIKESQIEMVGYQKQQNRNIALALNKLADLEPKVEKNTGYRNEIIGGIKIISILGLSVLGMFYYLINIQFNHLEEKIINNNSTNAISLTN